MNNHYDDIITSQRPVSATHHPTTLANRAAQFAPFAALTGLDTTLETTANRAAQRFG